MSELDRPSWCPFKSECLCLSSYDEAGCSGRMAVRKQHDELYNTHRLCMYQKETEEIDTFEINDADAHYIIRLMKAVRDDVRCNNLYHPGRGDYYDIFNLGGN